MEASAAAVGDTANCAVLLRGVLGCPRIVKVFMPGLTPTTEEHSRIHCFSNLL
jgi:hypothetical protein